MDPSRRLFELISAMSKQEKRYFKLYSSFYAKKSGKKCEQLFDIYNRYDSADDQKLQKSLDKQFSSSSLSRLRNELTSLVLDSLVSFRAQHMMDTEARSALQQVEVLLEKGLHLHAARLLEKAKKKAAEVENHALQMQTLFWERSLLLSRYDKNIQQQLTDFYAEAETVMAQQKTHYAYSHLQDFALLAWGSYKRQADEDTAAQLRSLPQHPLIADGTNATTVKSQVARLHILGIVAQSRNQMEEASRLYEEIIALMEAHPALLRKNGNQYVRFMWQHLGILVELRNDEDAARVAKRIKEFDEVPEHLRVVFSLAALGQELNLFLNLRKTEQAARAVGEIEEIMESKQQSIHPQSYLNLCHNCMAFYFLVGDNAAALEYVNNILAENRVVVRKDIQDCARAYNLVLHYELGHTETLEHLFRSTYRYLKQHDKLDSIEKVILNWVRKLLNTVSRGERAEIFGGLFAELNSMRSSQSQHVLGLDELFFWAQSKVENRSIEEVWVQSPVE